MNQDQIAISTVSLGWHSTHTLEAKITAAANNNFIGIELFITDLVSYAERYKLSIPEACTSIKALCDSHELEIIALSSLDNFEGSHVPLAERLEKATQWFEYARNLGTSIIQIPSNDDPNANGDEKTIVSELQALADLGSQSEPPIWFAYEVLAWGTHVADWEESLRIVQLVDRENFELCLDSYHVLARLWADPRATSGRKPGGDAALRASLNRFMEECPIDKIFFVQLSDAERMVPPILPGHPAYMVEKDGSHAWCSYGRVFPFEEDRGAYLPMRDLLETWLRKNGWEGWVSLEIFHRDMKLEANTPDHWAERGQRSWQKVIEVLEKCSMEGTSVWQRVPDMRLYEHM